MSEERIATRKEIKTKVEFIVDGDIISAESVNISTTGISFTTDNPIKIRMRFEEDGETKEELAELVWAKQDEKETSYGLSFIPISEGDI